MAPPPRALHSSGHCWLEFRAGGGLTAGMKALRWLPLFLLTVSAVAAESPAQAAFWKTLQALCGQAFEGRVVEGTAPSDAAFKDQRLVMHVRACGENEIRIPFHVGANRSRTWVITRTADGLRLKHDHRHEDGSEDKVTQYGGDTIAPGSAERQDFPADAFTAQLIPAAATNIWTMAFGPGKIFTYGLRREAEGRRFRVEFDLTKPVEAPAAPWGAPASR
jgi:hypothetical protein